jgi:hypothetical protein
MSGTRAKARFLALASPFLVVSNEAVAAPIDVDLASAPKKSDGTAENPDAPSAGSDWWILLPPGPGGSLPFGHSSHSSHASHASHASHHSGSSDSYPVPVPRPAPAPVYNPPPVQPAPPAKPAAKSVTVTIVAMDPHSNVVVANLKDGRLFVFVFDGLTTIIKDNVANPASTYRHGSNLDIPLAKDDLATVTFDVLADGSNRASEIKR